MKKILLALILSVSSLIAGIGINANAETAYASNVPLSEYYLKIATVVRVIDGDTIVVRLSDDSQWSVRLIGFDAPEDTTVVEAFGPEATAYLRGILSPGQMVWLEREGNNLSFNRLRRHVWLTQPSTNEVNIRQNLTAARMVHAGLGEVLPNFTPRYRNLLLRIENEARDARRGLWSLPRVTNDVVSFEYQLSS